ncbi:MAG: 4-hydroxy-3-methylbut-2-enyl diphosphate reductase, partial [Verrucomicrobiales bacterium]|nr:4-hydroxy-3-methylbut-2-enyl diphosphate reductase [Verrucomicrobiales bacterium]
MSAPASRRVNVRTPEVMQLVQAEVETHYRSALVDSIRKGGGLLTVGNTTIRLARDFGFCYGVERAIDLAYASRRVFPDRNVYLLGEIIHNPEVNRQLSEMNVISLPVGTHEEAVAKLTSEDVVIVPAFGAETRIMNIIAERGCMVVDTTCGDVMSVWKRVRKYAVDGFTSIIHGKASHEETRATSSRALGQSGNGQYLVILTLDDVDYVCDYIRKGGGDREGFITRFGEAASPGFDPDMHLKRIGVANQTTMLKSETEEIQRRLRAAVIDRDGETVGDQNFQVFDTICGATQERQDSLFDMLKLPLDILLVVGGYNSSNTTHLVEIGEKQLPTFFIRTAECLRSLEQIVHFDLHLKQEKESYTQKLASDAPIQVGVTAGASCPNNLIEDTILRVFQLRGIQEEEVRAALA